MTVWVVPGWCLDWSPLRFGPCRCDDDDGGNDVIRDDVGDYEVGDGCGDDDIVMMMVMMMTMMIAPWFITYKARIMADVMMPVMLMMVLMTMMFNCDDNHMMMLIIVPRWCLDWSVLRFGSCDVDGGHDVGDYYAGCGWGDDDIVTVTVMMMVIIVPECCLDWWLLRLRSCLAFLPTSWAYLVAVWTYKHLNW